LVVTADDFGIGPATSEGILELARKGRVRSAVLLVNSPHAPAAVAAWNKAGRPLELGWHPCLTLDQPILPLCRVRTLVDARGRFWPLGQFIRRLWSGHINPVEIEGELRAQYHRFHEMTGSFPAVVNSHHHVQVFHPIGALLNQIFDRYWPLPYLRRIREPWSMLARIPGARLKRAVLNYLGRADARRQDRSGFPGNRWLAGITNPGNVHDPEFLVRWLSRIPGEVVELTCHPGHHDLTLLGRDCWPRDGQLERRVKEFNLLNDQRFLNACLRNRFTLVSPSELSQPMYNCKKLAA
jgi:predicted glycoside hydrolase/deacetylase ChbG (UPF0249 family)